MFRDDGRRLGRRADNWSTPANGRALEEGAGLLTFKRELRELELRGNELRGRTAVAEMSAKDARSRLTGLEESVVLPQRFDCPRRARGDVAELNAST